MPPRDLLRVLAVLAGCLSLFLLVREWVYLGQGYSLQVGLEGETSQAYAISFPQWRKLATLIVGVLLLGGLCTLAMHRRTAVPLLSLALLVALAIGLLDLREYGLLGSPTSWKPLGVMAFTLAMAVYARRSGLLR